MNHTLFCYRDSKLPRLTTIASLICIVIWAGIALGGDKMTWAQASRWGFYPDAAIWEGEPWALLTSAFVHQEIWHLGLNIYAFWALGTMLEETIGWWRWLLFILGADLVSSSLQLLTSGGMGIGLSGVVYAIFGFCWVARSRVPLYRMVITQQTVNTAIGWLVGCIIITQLGFLQVANGAHAAGLAFGVVVGALFLLRWKPVLSGAGLVVLLGLSVLPLFWCPLSADWNERQAINAFNNKQYVTAITYYRRYIDRGGDKSLGLSNIAISYLNQGNEGQYSSTMKELNQVDSKAAQKLAAQSGIPLTSS